MVATSLDGVLLYGVAASRPAANAVAKGTLYSATDTGVVTQSDGVSTWGTFLSVSATGIPATIVDVKGDLIAATAADTVARLAAGANNTILMAASGETTGLKWHALTISDASASGDTTMTNANTFYDGVSTSLVAGTWLVFWKILFESVNPGTARQYSSKLWDGTTVWDEAQNDGFSSLAASGAGWQTANAGFGSITLGGTTTVKISGACNEAGQKIKRDNNANSPTSNTATRILAVRLA